MKFTSQFAVAVLATGAVSRVVDRQIATVNGVLGDVSDGIDSLDSAVKAFSGDGKPVVSASEDLVSTIKDGEQTISGSEDLTLQDALGLQEPVTDLTAHAQTLTDDLKAQRESIQAAGLCASTRKQLGDINSASQALIEATVAKVPEAAQSIAETLASGVTEVLNEAQDAFSEENCKDAAGSDDGDDGKTSAAPTTTPAETGSASPTTSASKTADHSTAGSPTTSADSKPTTISTPPQGNATTTGAPPALTAGAANLAPAGAFIVAAVAALL